MPMLKCPGCGSSMSIAEPAGDQVITCTTCGDRIRRRRRPAPTGKPVNPGDLPVTLGWDDEDQAAAPARVGAGAAAASAHALSGDKCAVTLTRAELQAELPRICMCCGAPATLIRHQGFKRVQVAAAGTGIGALVALVVMAGQAAEATVLGRHELDAPFCERHRNHWARSGLAFVIRLGLALTFLFGMAAMFILPHALGPGITLAAALIWIIALFAVAVIGDRTLAGTVAQFEPHREYLFLHNVSKEFCDELERLRVRRGSAARGPYSEGRLDAFQRWGDTKLRLNLYLVPGLATLGLLIALGVLGSQGKLTDQAWLSSPSPWVKGRDTPTDDWSSAQAAGSRPAWDDPIPARPEKKRPRDREVVDRPPPEPEPQPVRPPEPPPEPEGPAPKGWTVVFRASNPQLWNSRNEGDQFAMPLSSVHRAIRYVRLRRMDTGDYQVMPITRDELSGSPGRPAEEGAWWNGTSGDQYGGRHLGIVAQPRLRGQTQHISVMDQGFDSFSGSGFGHKRHIGDKQYYCWQGKEIGKTVFEIAVTADPLAPEERQFLAAPDGIEDAPKGWLVLFRSNDPTLWNTTSAGENLAVPAWRAPRDVRFLRLKRMDSGAAEIMPITRIQVGTSPERLPADGTFWNGAAEAEAAARMLGIAQGTAIRFPPPPDALALARGRDLRFFRGSGFATKLGKKGRPEEQQFYSWKGQQIAKTAFEIAVTLGPLTDEEQALLVK